MLRILIATSLVLLPVGARAQQQPTPDPTSSAARCLLAGKSFSVGATVRASSQVDVCDPTGAWVASDKPASGCFAADNFYSVGASSNATKSLIETCQLDGTWSATPAKD